MLVFHIAYLYFAYLRSWQTFHDVKLTIYRGLALQVWYKIYNRTAKLLDIYTKSKMKSIIIWYFPR